jgi:carbon monoxide dehydrogenase subunit G
MWFEMRRENMGFVDRAPVVHAAEARLGASRADVFRALVDPGGWPEWFPGVRSVSYQTPAPYGVGTVRVADVGGTRWIEEIIAWDGDRRWAWTVVRASVPLATAQVEAFDLADDGDRTRIQWTLALEPRLIARLGAPFMGGSISRLLVRAMRNLEGRLRR